ncbi:MAG TPA: hypothetical protein VGK79_13245 [Gaiellaceae bacterium]
MRRLRTLSEAECYARCYGDHDPTVQAMKLEPRRPRYVPTVTGEHLRRRLEERLDDRLVADSEAA